MPTSVHTPFVLCPTYLVGRWLGQSDAGNPLNLFKAHPRIRHSNVSHQIPSECVWMSLKEWELEADEFFAERTVYILQQTV